MPDPRWLATIALLLPACAPASAQTRSGHPSFAAAASARDAVERADLVSVRAAGRELLAIEALARDPGYAPMRAAAHALASATDAEPAARATAELALQCGACHRTTGARPPRTEGPRPARGDLPGRMRRHAWAAARMWDALAVPDDALYAAGASELIDAPLLPPDAPSAQRIAPEARALADRLRTSAREARAAASGPARAAAYGEILATCAECHWLLGTGGGGRAQ